MTDEWLSEDDFANDVVHALINDKFDGEAFVRTVGNTVEFAHPDWGVFVIDVQSAEFVVNGAD